MNHDKDQKVTDDQQNQDEKQQANGQQQVGDSRNGGDLAQQLIGILGGDAGGQKVPSVRDEIASVKQELATLKVEKVLSKQFPNAPEETIMRLSEMAASLEGDLIESFTADLQKLIEVNAEKQTNQNLEYDAAGSTSKGGDASGQRTRAMGPSSWGAAVDLAFVG